MASDTKTVTVGVTATPQPKDGVGTSEFQWNVVTSAILAVLGYTTVLPVDLAAKLVAGLTGTYTIGRVVLKTAHALGYAKNIPDAPPLNTGGGA